MYRWISLVGLLVVLGACVEEAGGGAEEADSVAREEDLRRLEAELVEADRRFARDVQRLRLGGWTAGFAPTGRMVSGGRSHIGPEGIRRAMLPVFADSTFSLNWDPTYAEVAASGDLGYTVGRYEATSRASGETVVDSGTYLTVWRRQPDGSWKVQADIGNPASDR